MRLTVNLEDDLYRMAKAYAVSENISITQAINRWLGRVCRPTAPPGSQTPNAMRRTDPTTGLPVVRGKRPVSTDEVQRLEDVEDVRHWQPIPERA